MSKTITKEVYRYLANHAGELQDKKMNIVNAYSMDFNAYMALLDFINLYVKKIEVYLDHAKIANGRHELPFAIIGSVVHIKNGGEISKYKIILPDRNSGKEICKGAKSETCLSDIGKALLFCEAGEEVHFNAGGEKTAGRIEEIEFELLL